MRLLLTQSCNTVLSTITVPLTSFPLCLLLLLRLSVSTVNLCAFYFYMPVPLEAFFFCPFFQFFLSILFLANLHQNESQGSVGLILAKASAMRATIPMICLRGLSYLYLEFQIKQ